jgi:hypothetical protein
VQSRSSCTYSVPLNVIKIKYLVSYAKMPLINTLALLSSSSIAHLTLSYYLLTNPAAVAKHSFVAILGASMGLVRNLPPSTI